MGYLEDKAEIQEQPFQSQLPVIGGLVARIRTSWNNVAARWYVQALFQQQNEFNRLIAQQAKSYDERLIAQDRDITALAKMVAELELQIKQLKNRP